MTLEFLEIMEDVNRQTKGNKTMTASETLLKALKGFEGLSLTAYEDAAGILTIGYGHTGKDVCAGDRISEYWAEQLLRQDVRTAEQAVNKLEVARTQGQFDALVSFVYNLGIGRLSSSTLLKVIRRGGSKKAITREFKRWVYAGGRKLKGLERRRVWEARRYFGMY